MPCDKSCDDDINIISILRKPSDHAISIFLFLILFSNQNKIIKSINKIEEKNDNFLNLSQENW